MQDHRLILRRIPAHLPDKRDERRIRLLGLGYLRPEAPDQLRNRRRQQSSNLIGCGQAERRRRR